MLVSTVFFWRMQSCIRMTTMSRNNVIPPSATVVVLVSLNSHDDPLSDSVISVRVSVIYGCKYKSML